MAISKSYQDFPVLFPSALITNASEKLVSIFHSLIGYISKKKCFLSFGKIKSGAEDLHDSSDNEPSKNFSSATVRKKFTLIVPGPKQAQATQHEINYFSFFA